MLYNKGFREKSHFALLVAVRELFSKQLENSLIEAYGRSMELRQQADYGMIFSEEGASQTIEAAEKFLEKTRQIIRSRPP